MNDTRVGPDTSGAMTGFPAAEAPTTTRADTKLPTRTAKNRAQHIEIVTRATAVAEKIARVGSAGETGHMMTTC